MFIIKMLSGSYLGMVIILCFWFLYFFIMFLIIWYIGLLDFCFMILMGCVIFYIFCIFSVMSGNGKGSMGLDGICVENSSYLVVYSFLVFFFYMFL